MSIIQLDREREPRLTNKEISQIERRYKKPFIKMMQDPLNLMADEQIYILYQGLKCEDPTITLEKVEDLVAKFSNMGKVMEIVSDISLEAYGTTREEAEQKALELNESNENPLIATVE